MEALSAKNIAQKNTKIVMLVAYSIFNVHIFIRL